MVVVFLVPNICGVVPWLLHTDVTLHLMWKGCLSVTVRVRVYCVYLLIGDLEHWPASDVWEN